MNRKIWGKKKILGTTNTLPKQTTAESRRSSSPVCVYIIDGENLTSADCLVYNFACHESREPVTAQSR